MAWFAEMKRRQWYRVIGMNMIRWYSNKLYEEWWNGLTDEQRERIEEIRRKRKEKNDAELRECFMRLGLMTNMILGLSSRNHNYEKFHGVYDEFGFPRL